MKFFHFLDVGNVVTLLRKKNFCELEILSHNSHHSLILDKKSFWKFVKYFWRYSISAGTLYGEKLKLLHFLDVGKVLTMLLQNQNIYALQIFNENSHVPLLSAQKKIFEDSLNTSGDIAFLKGHCKGKIEIFIFSGCWKSCNVVLQNQNICSFEILNHNSDLFLLLPEKKFLKLRYILLEI